MDDLLYHFFATNKRLRLPSIGELQVKKTPASSDFGAKTLSADKEEVLFVQSNADNFEASFQDFAVAHNFEKKDLDNYLSTLLQKLKEDGHYAISGLGIVEREGEGYRFHPTYRANQYLPRLENVELVVRHEAEHVVRVGDEEKSSREMREGRYHQDEGSYWWVYAIVFSLGLAGIVALYYYYFYLPGL